MRFSATLAPPPEPNTSIRVPSGISIHDMFSMTPANVCFVCVAMDPARSATWAAADWGVVTTRSSESGSSCATEQIEQEHVEVAPEHIREELLQGAMEHRTPPDYGLARRDEHADAHHLHIVSDLGQDHLIDAGRLSGETEHAGDGEAVDIGVDDADAQALIRQGHGEIRSHRRFADSALS